MKCENSAYFIVLMDLAIKAEDPFRDATPDNFQT
jgi:hypothetical protein